jgi:hypothetical protein
MCLLLALIGTGATACTSDGAPRASPASPLEAGGGGAGSVNITVAAVRTGPVPLGEPFALTVGFRNEGARSATVPFGVDLTGPDGRTVSFLSSKQFVSAGKEASAPVAVTPAQWFPDRGRYTVAVTVAGKPSGATIGFDVVAPTAPVPVFKDVTAAAGLTTSVPSAKCGQFANGAAWADVNGDGSLDLLLTRLGDPVQLFVNDGAGHFTDQAAARGLAVTDANGASFADYDNDGHPDLVLVRDGSDLLFRNDGTGHFTDVSAAAGIGDPDDRGMSASWGDYDGDGHLDLYVTNYMQCTGDWGTEEQIIANVAYYPDTLYHSNGDGTFTNVTPLLEHDPSTWDDGGTNGAGFAAAWFDYNGDGRPDLYLANDFVGPQPDHNHLWRNDGPAPGGGWTFTDVSNASGTGFWMNTMGIAVGDYDRDGHPDLALTNIGANKLLHNDGNGSFVEEESAGTARPTQDATYDSITWGGGFADFNLDGWEDLYLAAGNFQRSPDTPVGVQPNELYVNDGAGRFLDVSAATGAADPGDSKGVALADYNRDGKMDVFVVNQGGPPHLYENVTPSDSDHWLEVDTVGTTSNRDGCGARLVASLADGSHLTRQVLCGSTSVASGTQRTVHFGLGSAATVDRLEVVWPSGIDQTLDDLPADRLVTIQEPHR